MEITNVNKIYSYARKINEKIEYIDIISTLNLFSLKLFPTFGSGQITMQTHSHQTFNK